jgi:hypothetical protein
MARVCRAEGCDKNAVTNGFCPSCNAGDRNSRALRDAFDLHYVEVEYGAKCAGPDCSAPAVARGLCGKHYRTRWWQTAINTVPDRPRFEYEGDEAALIEAQKENGNGGN